MPCVHCAPSSSLNSSISPREPAIVVYLRVGAPSAHWANVRRSALSSPSNAARIVGMIHSGALSANRPHHATPSLSP
eukprot:4140263-Pleurochrysis_carterae.AAC.2